MAQYDWIFFGNFDLALVSLYLFWLFFAGLIWYIQRENMREGYPLENDDGELTASNLPMPEPKTFKLPHGRGEVTAPDNVRETRELALDRTSETGGYPFAPTGDPMVDGVGPSSWAARRDEPELDGHAKPKLQPMAVVGDFAVAAGRDPRGMDVIGNDGARPGKVTDMWVDVPEQLVRYLEITLQDGSKRLLPMTMARIKANGVHVLSIPAERFVQVPQIAATGEVTKLEEDKISGFYAGGYMYASDKRRSKLAALAQVLTGTPTPARGGA